MRLMYRIHLEEPHEARVRSFVREVEFWPFAGLPTSGDAVLIEVPSTGGMDNLGARVIERVIYSPATTEAYIDFRVRPEEAWIGGIDEQADLLRRAGFREVRLTRG
jgi:hypothetical protein